MAHLQPACPYPYDLQSGEEEKWPEALGMVDVITCLPYAVGAGPVALGNSGSLMAFTPTAKEDEWEQCPRRGGEEMGTPTTERASGGDTSDASRPTSAAFEGRLKFDEDGEEVTLVKATTAAHVHVLQPGVQPGVGPGAQQRYGTDIPDDSCGDRGASTSPAVGWSGVVEPHPSRLPTPKRQLKKCSTFDKSVCPLPLECSAHPLCLLHHT